MTIEQQLKSRLLECGLSKDLPEHIVEKMKKGETLIIDRRKKHICITYWTVKLAKCKIQ